MPSNKDCKLFRYNNTPASGKKESKNNLINERMIHGLFVLKKSLSLYMTQTKEEVTEKIYETRHTWAAEHIPSTAPIF